MTQANEQQFETEKKQALQAMNQAVQTIQQMISMSDTQALKQASNQLQQVTQLINQMQGIAITQSPTTTQQQLEEVRQQIEQAAQTLQLIQSLNSGNNSFKKG